MTDVDHFRNHEEIIEMAEHVHNHDDDEPTALEVANSMLQKEMKKVRDATALPSVKDAILHRVFPIMIQTLEAVQQEADMLRAELLGDDDEDGAVDELEGRLDAVEERMMLAMTGFELRTKLASLARSVKAFCGDKPNVVEEADAALSYVEELERQADEALKAVAEETGQEVDLNEALAAVSGQPTTNTVSPTPPSAP